MTNKYFLCCATALCFLGFSCSNKDQESNIRAINNYNQTPIYYQQYRQPRSVIYRNPYQSPPQGYYPYYDHDYYYVPPSNYRNTEPLNNGGPDTTKY